MQGSAPALESKHRQDVSAAAVHQLRHVHICHLTSSQLLHNVHSHSCLSSRTKFRPPASSTLRNGGGDVGVGCGRGGVHTLRRTSSACGKPYGVLASWRGVPDRHCSTDDWL